MSWLKMRQRVLSLKGLNESPIGSSEGDDNLEWYADTCGKAIKARQAEDAASTKILKGLMEMKKKKSSIAVENDKAVEEGPTSTLSLARVVAFQQPHKRCRKYFHTTRIPYWIKHALRSLLTSEDL